MAKKETTRKIKERSQKIVPKAKAKKHKINEKAPQERKS
jgi:hypothetical protein